MAKKNYLTMLRDVYVAYHREGWEEGKTISEVMDEIKDVLANEGIEPIFEVIEEVE